MYSLELYLFSQFRSAALKWHPDKQHGPSQIESVHLLLLDNLEKLILHKRSSISALMHTSLSVLHSLDVPERLRLFVFLKS